MGIIKKKFGLTEQEINNFRKNGYHGPFTVYEPNEMDEILKKLRYQVLDRTNSIYKMDSAVSEINNISNYDRHLDVPFLKDHIKNPIIADKLVDILGDDVLCWRSEWFPKYPKEKGTHWHQADTFEFATGQPLISWPQKEDFGGCITVWTALTDTNVDTACLKFMPGTHKEMFYDESMGSQYNADEADNGFFGYDYKNMQKNEDWVPDESNSVSMEMKAGQSLIFWSTLMHASHPHLGLTDKFRLAYVSRYVPDMVDVYPGNPKTFKGFGALLSLEKYKCVVVAGENKNKNNKV